MDWKYYWNWLVFRCSLALRIIGGISIVALPVGGAISITNPEWLGTMNYLFYAIPVTVLIITITIGLATAPSSVENTEHSLKWIPFIVLGLIILAIIMIAAPLYMQNVKLQNQLATKPGASSSTNNYYYNGSSNTSTAIDVEVSEPPKFLLPDTSTGRVCENYPKEGNGNPVLVAEVQLYMCSTETVNSIQLEVVDMPPLIPSTKGAFKAYPYTDSFSNFCNGLTYFLGVPDKDRGHSAKIDVFTENGEYQSAAFDLPNQ
ncbi:MAG: hypothetical protein WB588_06560 [Dehalococcoidia bacterium]